MSLPHGTKPVGEALQAEKSVWRGFRQSQTSLLSTAVTRMELLVGFLRRLRAIAGEHAASFRSDGLTRFSRCCSTSSTTSTSSSSRAI